MSHRNRRLHFGWAAAYEAAGQIAIETGRRQVVRHVLGLWFVFEVHG